MLLAYVLPLAYVREFLATSNRIQQVCLAIMVLLLSGSLYLFAPEEVNSLTKFFLSPSKQIEIMATVGVVVTALLQGFAGVNSFVETFVDPWLEEKRR